MNTKPALWTKLIEKDVDADGNMILHVFLFHQEYQITLVNFTFNKSKEQWEEPIQMEVDLEPGSIEQDMVKVQTESSAEC